MKALWRKGGASFWAAGCGVIRAQGLAPHGLRVLEAARAPQGGVPGASGWVGPLDALQALDPTPGPVSLGCLHSIAAVSPRYLPGVSPMLMASTWEKHRGDTGEIPCRLAWGGAGGGPGILNSEKGTRHRPLAGNRPGLFIFTTVSLAQPAGAGQQRVFIGSVARKGRIHAPKLEKPAEKRPKKALTPEFTTG
jgi:hypothetical protein